MATKKALAPAKKAAANKVAVNGGINVNRIKDVAKRTTDVNHVEVKLISIHKGLNPRDYRLPENRAHLDELKRSIYENGVKVPVLVRMDPATKEIILLDGECRVTACLELLKEHKGKLNEDGSEPRYLTVPTTQLNDKEYPTDEDKLLQAVIANQGKPLSMWEQGNAFRRFLKGGWTLERVVKQSGYDHKYVAQAIALDKAPDDLKQALTSAAITPSLATATLRKVERGEKGAVSKVIQQAAEAKAAGKKGPLGVRAAAKPTIAQQRTAAAAKRDREAKAAAAGASKGQANGKVESATSALLLSCKKEIKESVKEGYKYVSVKMGFIKNLTDIIGGERAVFGEAIFPEE